MKRKVRLEVEASAVTVLNWTVEDVAALFVITSGVVMTNTAVSSSVIVPCPWLSSPLLLGAMRVAFVAADRLIANVSFGSSITSPLT